ncbi:MAG: MltA domain-containing protein [Proteobacteria bacterium]|nr:MltA domain-containing protein [Pseudomonadota bacterium]
MGRGSARQAASVFSLSLVVLLVACAPRVEEPRRLDLEPVGFDVLPGWQADNHAAALAPLLATCRRIDALPDERALALDPRFGAVGAWRAPCAAAAALVAGGGGEEAEGAARRFFETWFTPFALSAGGGAEGLFTGYYEPELEGSWTQGEKFTVPLYRRPDDLVMVDLGLFRDELRGRRIAGKVVEGWLRPYESRREIEGGGLAGRGLELLWVDDPIAAFFLQVQGSGRVRLPDGQTVRIGYAGQNGHDYVSVGRVLIERGALAREGASLQSIRVWLKANPKAAAEVLAANPSFVFFRVVPGDGPVGALGVALTPGRSLAVDPLFVPLGVPLWLDLEDPLAAGTRLRRLVLAQDTGGAIRGPIRGDLFWGAGAEAEERAGRMKSRGRYFLLLPKSRPTS